MAFNQRLDMRQGQSLVMTPQLQQAIKLLQLSNIELAEFVAEEIERNPLLERGEAASDPAEYDAPETDKAAGREELALDGSNEKARDAVDASDADMYESGTGSDEARPANAASGPSASTDWSNVGSGRGGEDFDFEGSLSTEKSLHEYLHEQLNMAGLSQADRLIAARLIDETDEAGYCKVDFDEVGAALGADPANVAAVLEVCQGFDPTGVMARDLTECLALQLTERDRYDPVMQTFLENLDLVAKHDIKCIAELCGVDKEDVMDMLLELRTLSPRP
ncbi:MAG: RNA polymerase sigma-54 factor, partial [Pseudomonadota bacterium]